MRTLEIAGIFLAKLEDKELIPMAFGGTVEAWFERNKRIQQKATWQSTLKQTSSRHQEQRHLKRGHVNEGIRLLFN